MHSDLFDFDVHLTETLLYHSPSNPTVANLVAAPLLDARRGRRCRPTVTTHLLRTFNFVGVDRQSDVDGWFDVHSLVNASAH